MVQRVPESDPYPITPKDHGIDFLMDHRHLWLRSRRQHAILRVRHEVIRAIRDYFDSNGFTLLDTPIFTPAACEGTTTLFEVNYFDDEKVYLTQSGQLYNEATAMAFGNVYSFGPTFRAEKSKTRRHLTEFWMVEPEMAYATLDDVKRVAEELVVFVVGRVLENRRAELATLERDISKLEAVKAPFPRISYDQAVEILQEEGQRDPVGRRLRRDRRDAHRRGLRPAGDGGPLPRRHQGLLHAARSGAARRWRWAWTCWPPRATARSSAAASASTIWICCCERIEEHRLPARGLRLVHRPAQATARCRTADSAWASSAAWPGSAAWSTSARPSPSRACSTARKALSRRP